MDCNKVCNKVIILTVSATRKTSHIRQIDRLIMLTLINLPKIKTKAVVLRSPRSSICLQFTSELQAEDMG